MTVDTALLLARLSCPDPRDRSTWRVDGIAPDAAELAAIEAATPADFAAASAIYRAERAVMVATMRDTVERLVLTAERAGRADEVPELLAILADLEP